MTLWNGIEQRIAAATGSAFTGAEPAPVGGGCINRAYRLEGGGRRFFVKLNDADRLEMFEAEAAGLAELAAAGAVRVPRPICLGAESGQSFLVLEYLELHGDGAAAEERLGRELAALHRVTRPRYGWARDNTIGATPQPNGEMDDWVAFWRERRIGFQLELAARHGHGGELQRKGRALLERLDLLLDGHVPPASLLHGDLWGGNWSVDASGRPVLFDPAVYFGDRETDLAMTALFGGFGPRFYGAYAEAWPLEPGYGERRALYNLYHVLNHLNLFGGGYLGQALALLDRLLRRAA